MTSIASGRIGWPSSSVITPSMPAASAIGGLAHAHKGLLARGTCGTSRLTA